MTAEREPVRRPPRPPADPWFLDRYRRERDALLTHRRGTTWVERVEPVRRIDRI